MNNNPQFPASYLLLQQEGYLISSCLAAGLTNLRKANLNNKGAFYSSFFNLSVGIERLLKSIVIMNHMLNNNLSVPSKNKLKSYGHGIIELYNSSVSIGNNRNIKLQSFSEFDSINREILKLLSHFAQSSRYHNLDALSSSQNGKDPLANWGEIMLSILDQDVPENQQIKVLNQANVIVNSMKKVSSINVQGLNKKPLSIEEAFTLPGLYDLAAKYAVLRLVIILSKIRTLISSLSHEAYKLGRAVHPFPQMHEFLEWVWDNKQYVLRKKRWP